MIMTVVMMMLPIMMWPQHVVQLYIFTRNRVAIAIIADDAANCDGNDDAHHHQHQCQP